MCSKKNGELIEPLIPVYPDETCKDTFTFSWPIDGAVGMDIIETADSESGPWYEYINVATDAAELAANEASVEINNSFNGQRWFRLARNGVVFRDMVRPAAALIEMPSNVAVANTIASPYGLHMTGPFVRPVSAQENSLINPTAVYVEPVNRLQYFKDIAWDGIPTTVSMTAPSGAAAKWTRDGTDPTDTLPWPPPVYEGAQYNARTYYPDFGLAIRSRCFSGECKSPLSIVLVDVQYNTLEMAKTTGETVGVFSSCDLPKIVNGITYESGLSCEVRYGGTANFIALLEAFACSSMVGPAGISGAGKRTIVRMTSADGVGVSWGGGAAGWPAYLYDTSKFFMNDLVPTGYRDNFFWNEVPLVFEYALTSFLPSSPFKTVIAGPGLTGGPLAGVGGDITDHAHQVGIYLVNFLPTCEGGANGTILLTDFEVLRSIQNDNTFYTPPQLPQNPNPPVVHTITVYEDDMESYLDTADASVPVLNGGTGWSLKWNIAAYTVVFGEDDMQSYMDGAIVDSADADPVTDLVYHGGGGWASDWHFSTDARNVIGGDDFQSYTDGVVIVGNLKLGVSWDTDSFWWIYPGQELGGDDFEEYTDGVIVDQSLNLGERWIGIGWKVT